MIGWEALPVADGNMAGLLLGCCCWPRILELGAAAELPVWPRSSWQFQSGARRLVKPPAKTRQGATDLGHPAAQARRQALIGWLGRWLAGWVAGRIPAAAARQSLGWEAIAADQQQFGGSIGCLPRLPSLSPFAWLQSSWASTIGLLRRAWMRARGVRVKRWRRPSHPVSALVETQVRPPLRPRPTSDPSDPGRGGQ